MKCSYKNSEDPGFSRYTAETMLPLLSQLEQELSGVRSSDDIEYVHRARVATRRLRACFTIFSSSLPSAHTKRWRKKIRNLTKALGEARDLDVQITFVHEYFEKKVTDSGNEPLFFHYHEEEFRVPTDTTYPNQEESVECHPCEKKPGVWPYAETIDHKRPGLECLLFRLVQRRLMIQPDVVKVVNTLEESGDLEAIATCLHEQKIKAELADTGENSHYAYEQAFLHIMTAMQDLFWYEPWLSDPDMIHRHHEMRIAAKRLRYTLESFSGLFECGLKSEIKMFKSLQDVLGDMHDCDVWIEKIPYFIKDEKERALDYFGNPDFFSWLEPGFLDLLENRKKKRTELFRELQNLWNSMKEEGFWIRLEEKISIPVQYSFQEQCEQDPKGPVKIALISDVHANLPALEAVLFDAKERGASAVFNAGDSIGYGAFPDEVMTLLRSSHVLSVIGNYDRSVLSKKWKTGRPKSRDKQIAMRYAYHHLSRENRAYLAALPRQHRFRVRGTSILVTHGSPGSLNEYLVQETPETRFQEIAQKSKADIIVTGHAHIPSMRQVDGVWFVNCGSVGRTEDGDPRACYALLSLDPFSIVHVRVSYDISRAIDALRKRHLPDSFRRIISEGKPLDVVSEPEDSL
jgi:putative phosphoesterase